MADTLCRQSFALARGEHRSFRRFSLNKVGELPAEFFADAALPAPASICRREVHCAVAAGGELQVLDSELHEFVDSAASLVENIYDEPVSGVAQRCAEAEYIFEWQVFDNPFFHDFTSFLFLDGWNTGI